MIGGGDGGILREICKHKEVTEIVICEIDQVFIFHESTNESIDQPIMKSMTNRLQKVIEISKKYLPTTAQGFNDKRVTVHVGDGAAFMKDRTGEFDIIIVDSSDPVGKFYSLMFKWN